MSLLIFALVVILVLALILWAIQILPLPASPPHIKEILMVLVIIIAAVVILSRSGIAEAL